jgi:ATP-dependent RNA helicase DeaD
LLAGRDVPAQAATGTGKTAAFALPLLHILSPKAKAAERTTALILVPTRELAMQVAEAVHRYGKELGAISLPVYGGASMENQVRALERGVDVVVATPGRALDHIRRRTLHLASVKAVVLDEADEMLDMGFAEDLEAILGRTPDTRQTALFSATLPKRILDRGQAETAQARSTARPWLRARPPAFARWRISSRAPTRWRHSAASSTSSTPLPPSCFAGREPRSTR